MRKIPNNIFIWTPVSCHVDRSHFLSFLLVKKFWNETKKSSENAFQGPLFEVYFTAMIVS
ncbi:hypothetical protein BMI76_06235 [Streptococcus sp. 'caviae']|nr:hypothetical protein BMI76_06235 [Streptococcus sp. 'caviae']